MRPYADHGGPPAVDLRTRTVTWDDPLAIAEAGRATSGADFLRAMIERKVPAPPVARLLGFEATEVAEGRVVFSYEPHESHYNPLGSVHGGVLASVIDAAVGCAVHTTLPQGAWYTTLALNTNFVRPVLATTGRMTCEGKAIHVGRTMATAEAHLRDAGGKLYAHATATQHVTRP